MNRFQQHRDREVRTLTGLAGAVCALGLAGSLSAAIEHAVSVVLLALVGVVVLVVLARCAARWLRERREDRADALVAAAWQARHQMAGAGRVVA
jgi:ABC-type transport system involved in cytochrome bd biosynthesis fused ATPase/permease subunit